MEKLSLFSSLQKSIDSLKATECSQKEKIAHFEQITETIVAVRSGSSSALFQNHLSAAIGTLLMFCEESDSSVRMSAEESLNRIVRFCEGHGCIVRIQVDLYHEIKKNGNERSLRICLGLFGHYCAAIKQRKGKIYAQNLLPCVYAISKRRETLVLESLASFVKIFTEKLESYMTDGEVLKMTELFVEDLAAECATKRRCASQNIDAFVAGSRCPSFYANNAFNRCIEMLLKNRDHNAVLGVLTCFRGILPIVLKDSSVEKSIEILDLVVHFLKDGNHSVVNEALEVIGVILGNLPRAARAVLLSNELDHRKFLLKRKTLKNSVFKINLSESLLSSRKSSTDGRIELLKPAKASLFLQVESTPTKFSPGDDKSLASASDLEMDSFRNSPEKKSEPGTPSQPDCSTPIKSQKSVDSLGSFINTFLTTSSNAGESVSKFFRKPFDSTVSTSGAAIAKDADLVRGGGPEEDDLSLESLASSQISMLSSNTETIRNELDVTPEIDDSVVGTEETITIGGNGAEEVTLPEAQDGLSKSRTASIASAMEEIADEAEPPTRQIFIGSIHEQNIVDYTVRLIASKFLLSGTPHGLIPDYLIRVSVKSMSLQIIAQCVQLRPEILLLPLEKDEPKEEFDIVEILSLEDAIREITNETIFETDEYSPTGAASGTAAAAAPETEGLLEMEEDHFGEPSATYFEYFSPMSISLDQGLSSLKTKLKLVEENFSTMATDNQEKLSKELDAILSQSDYSGEVARRGERRKELLVVPRVITSKGDVVEKRLVEFERHTGDQQMIADVLLLYDHPDQTLRGNVLLIVGNFLEQVFKRCSNVAAFLGSSDLEVTLKSFLKQDALLQVVQQGFFDEIHSVVIQALITFEQIFSVYCDTQPCGNISNNQPNPEAHCDVNFKPPPEENLFTSNRTPPQTNLEQLIEGLLLTFPNRYWLVQRKICDVIVALDYNKLRAVVGNKKARVIQEKCLNKLLTLLGDNDVRIRNYAGEKLLCYIERTYNVGEVGKRPDQSIVESFVENYVLSSFAEPIDRRKFTRPLDTTFFVKGVAQIFYTLSNQLLNLADRNQLLGTVNFLKIFIAKYDPFELVELWSEYNLLNVLLSLMCEHTGTALDLTAQRDLLEICSTLMTVIMATRGSISAVDNELIDRFFFHLLKIMNIYQHLFTNTKPVIIPRAQKGDLFINTRELQLVNCFGYFGSDHFYLKLYSLLRNSFESYRITITADAGLKLFDLLRATISSLWRLLEIKTISTMTNGAKFIEEVLRYLLTFLPYETEHCVCCTKFLLQFLFSCNYIDRMDEELAYFRTAAETRNLPDEEACQTFLDRYYEFWKLQTVSSWADLGGCIKQFEPIVIGCLKVFSRTTVPVQAAILDLLSQLLDYGVKYQLLDSGNVFVDYVLKHVELLETGMIRGSELLIEKIVKFLFLLSHSKERAKLVNIPKIINICDNLLANGLIRGTAIAALQSLAHEIFFLHRVLSTDRESSELAQSESATQKEVVLNMIIKFPGEIKGYGVLPMILLSTRQSQSYRGEIWNALVSIMQDGRLTICNERERMVVCQTLQSLGKDALLESRSLQSFLKIVFLLGECQEIPMNQKIIYWQMVLERVLLETEEGYLLSNIKLFLTKENAFAGSNCEVDALVQLLCDILYGSIENYHENQGGIFGEDCLIQLIQIVANFRKFNKINQSLRVKIDPNRLYSSKNNFKIKANILELLVKINYPTTKLLAIVDEPYKPVRTEQMVRHLLELLFDCKYRQSDWMSEEISALIDDHFDTLKNHFDGFLSKHVASIEHSSAIVSKIVHNFDASKPDFKQLNLLEESHLSNLPLFIEQLTKLLSNKNIAVARKSALIIDAKLTALLKLEAPQSDALLPKSQWYELMVLFTPELRKKFPKPFRSLLSLARCYEAMNPPEELITPADTNVQAMKQLIADDSWFTRQISFHCGGASYTKPKNISRMLLEVNSESKQINLLSGGSFNLRLLREVIGTAFEHMLHTFRVDCIQFNPHLNYLKVHPMLKVGLIVLMRKLDEIVTCSESDEKMVLHCLKATICFLENLNRMEHICLMYVEARFLDRFVKDHILKSNFFETLLLFARKCAQLLMAKIQSDGLRDTTSLELYLRSIDLTLRQKYLWTELNQNDKFRDDQTFYLCVVVDILKLHLRGTTFLRRYRPPEVFAEHIKTKYDQAEPFLQAIFIAEYVSETRNWAEENDRLQPQQQSLLKALESVAIAVLKTDRFYAFALTPAEVFNCYNFDVDVELLKLPSVPIDYLYELDTLEVFLRRVNIFGYSSKQQFEEIFMSLLVLINKEGDPDMINYQEQYEIKSMCLRAMTDLLLSCYKYPRIGFSDSKFHHVPRNPSIKFDSVGLKKLHHIQLQIPTNGIFYQPNLERTLQAPTTGDSMSCGADSAIGTAIFAVNQYSVRYSWQALEGMPSESLTAKNLNYFIEKTNLDVMSSVQLFYDVLAQLLEENFALALPHLVRFCEICGNRDQIRQLYTRLVELQERVAMEDTLSQQHIIYLLCKMAALLVPSIAELTHLCAMIPTYLKSTQLYIRNATLHGLMCLLECLVASNTTIGGLSEELQLLRNVIVNYIVKHGIIDESSTAFSDMHTRLVWTLNFYLIENTTRFVADCNLLSNTIISANNILKRTINLEIYLCILNGLERLVLANTTTRPLLEKVEKLALDLVKLDNEMFSLAALKLLVTCIYHSSTDQLENTERSNGIVQDEPDIIIQQIEKIEILFAKIRTTTPQGAKVFGDVLCQLIRDLLPPNEILTKVFKELMLNQPNPDTIATVTHQVFRSAIDCSYLTLLQEWLLCSLPNFLSLSQINKSVWCLTVIFISASLNQHLLKLFPEILSLPSYQQLNEREVNNFILSAKDFYRKLDQPQKTKFREIFQQNDSAVYRSLLQCLDERCPGKTVDGLSVSIF
ncbi:huntingtin [Toxorhynchites rutilus septentrionalis]|uniref:huntingtin n=1 Tax=Toxorhynchites rutilus septentrionalis TaxID=329112 RepID=UPI0024789BC2|nr:huntingtin [Toxorhynchites rutilus septentrionalis]